MRVDRYGFFTAKSFLAMAIIAAFGMSLAPAVAHAQVSGCTDPLANNYDPAAEVNDGSCTYNPATISRTAGGVVGSELLPEALRETSGLIFWNHKFWTHNDSRPSDQPQDVTLYGFTYEDVNNLEELDLVELQNFDWEEITQDDNHIYVGDIGNNANGNRTDLKIYKISKESILDCVPDEACEPETEVIEFSYSDQTDFSPTGGNNTDFDSEAFIVAGDKILVFTKQWVSEQTSMYEMPNEPGNHVAQLISTFDVQGLVTGSMYLESEKILVFVGYGSDFIPFMYLFYDFQGTDFFSGNKRKITLTIDSNIGGLGPQVEAVTTKNGLNYFLTNEFATRTVFGFVVESPQRIHELDLSAYLGGYMNSLDDPTEFYYAGFGDITNPASWFSNPNAAGRSPADFTADGITYHLTQTGQFVIDSEWTVAGNNSKVVLGKGLPGTEVVLASGADVNAVFDITDNATLVIDGGTVPEFGDIASGSTIHFRNITDLEVPANDYGSLVFEDVAFAPPADIRDVVVKGGFQVFYSDPGTAAPAALDMLHILMSGDADQLVSVVPSAEIGFLTVDKSGGILEVSSESDIRVLNHFALEDGAGGLELEGIVRIGSGATFINNSEFDPVLFFERLVTSPDYSGGNTGRWVAMSSPTAGAFAGAGGLLEKIWTQGFPDSDDNRPSIQDSPNVVLYKYNEGIGGWAAPEDNQLTAGKGFFFYPFKNKVRNNNATAVDFSKPFSIEGSVHPFDAENRFQFEDIVFNGTGPAESWNLLGNPTAASLDWSAEGPDTWDLQEISNFAYVWDPEIENYLAIETDGEGIGEIEGVTGSPYIAPFQAFWVRATGENPSISVGKEAMTTQLPVPELFKSPIKTPVLALELEMDGRTSATAFRFGSGYEAGYSDRDALYIPPMSREYAYLYSMADGLPVLLKSLPGDPVESIEIPLAAGIVWKNDGYQGLARISITRFDHIPEEWTLILHDYHAGLSVDLRKTDYYEFSMSRFAREAAHTDRMVNFQSPPGFEALSAAKMDHRFGLSISASIETDATDVNGVPQAFALDQNYPNPFNPATVIRYHLPEPGKVTLYVYDLLGRHIASLVNADKKAGIHSVTFDGSAVSSGIYTYVLTAGDQRIIRKMSLLK